MTNETVRDERGNLGRICFAVGILLIELSWIGLYFELIYLLVKNAINEVQYIYIEDILLYKFGSVSDISVPDFKINGKYVPTTCI